MQLHLDMPMMVAALDDGGLLVEATAEDGTKVRLTFAPDAADTLSALLVGRMKPTRRCS